MSMKYNSRSHKPSCKVLMRSNQRACYRKSTDGCLRVPPLHVKRAGWHSTTLVLTRCTLSCYTTCINDDTTYGVSIRSDWPAAKVAKRVRRAVNTKPMTGKMGMIENGIIQSEGGGQFDTYTSKTRHST